MDAEGFGHCTNHGECEAVCPKEISLEHIARMNRDFLKAMVSARTKLESRGIEYKRAVQGEHTVQIWINDPAGNTIELQQETRPA